MYASQASQVDAFLFDVGGTLLRVDYGCVSRTAGAHGVRLEESRFDLAEAQARRALDRRARREGAVSGSDASRFAGYFGSLLQAAEVPEARIEAIVREIELAHREENLWRVVMPGALETLRTLRERGKRTAAVSNSDGRIEVLLRGAGLLGHLDVVIDSHVEGVEKPDPEIFRRALSRLGVPAERCAYIGDIYSIDVVGARAAGIAPILIDPTGSYGDADCARIGALPELLDGAGDGRGEGGA